MGTDKEGGVRFKDLLIEAILIVTLLFGASALTSGQSQKLVEQVAHNTEQTAKLIQAQTCILAIPPDDRTDAAVNGCLTAADVSVQGGE